MSTELEQLREQLAAKRAANRDAAEQAMEAREIAKIREELEYEEARARAYADPKIGPGRVIGGEIVGAGFVVLQWPDPITWRYFNDRGILKKDGLKQELCDELVCRCLFWPALPRFRQILDANPTASTQLATAIIERMRPDDVDLGKGSGSSLPRR